MKFRFAMSNAHPIIQSHLPHDGLYHAAGPHISKIEPVVVMRMLPNLVNCSPKRGELLVDFTTRNKENAPRMSQT